MKLLLDECVPYTFVATLTEQGYSDVYHPIHVGLRGARDDQLLARAIAEHRIIVSPNARDFRRLLVRTTPHPGLIVPEQAVSTVMLKQILSALAFIETQADPDLYMINRVIEVSRSTGIRPYSMPSPP